MNTLIVVSQEDDWRSVLPGVQVVTARAWLTEPHYSKLAVTRIYNLCNDTGYQGQGYYVSMLAEARGQAVLPDVKALEDLQQAEVQASLAAPLHGLLQDALAHLAADSFALDCWFGHTPWAGCGVLAQRLFDTFRLPLLRAQFTREDGQWALAGIEPVSLSGLDEATRREVADAALAALPDRASAMRTRRRPGLAILRTPGSAAMPSNAAAIAKFSQAAQELGMRAEILTREEAERIHEFDALFIRDTTNVNNYTYQLARRAAVAGLVVMDDPDSIVRCSNKVYLHELLSRHEIPTPRTLLVHRDNLDQAIPLLGVPCILKQPDSAFSMGVVKAKSPKDLRDKAEAMFAGSELLLAQEYLPTKFDWRIGVLDRKVLFACRYHMAPGHWQVIKHEGDSRYSEGLAEALPLSAVPPQVLAVAVKAANLIGDGFYGVDLKERDGRCYVIEINDNPNVDAGNEDGVLQDALYREVVSVMRGRIERGPRRSSEAA